MSKKDSYWFRHDSTAGRGLKMRKMAHIYGHWGKGVYWDVVEILRDQDEYKFESDESSLQLLSDLIGCKDETKFINWFNDCLKIGLLSVSNRFFICPPLSENMEVWETKKNNGSKGGRPRKQRDKTESITETKTELKANQNHKRTEQKITEDNRIEDVYTDIEILKEKYLSDPKICSAVIDNKKNKIENRAALEISLYRFNEHLKQTGQNMKPWNDYTKHFLNWQRKDKTEKGSFDAAEYIRNGISSS